MFCDLNLMKSYILLDIAFFPFYNSATDHEERTRFNRLKHRTAPRSSALTRIERYPSDDPLLSGIRPVTCRPCKEATQAKARI